MRLSALLTFFLAAVFPSFAAVISPAQALDRVTHNATMKMLSASASARPRLISTATTDNEPTVYVFSVSDSTVMLLSADDRAAPLLGYSLEGSGINPVLQSWIDEYGREISWMRRVDADRFIHFSGQPSDKEPIAPMLTTKWNQSEPYNNMCPVVGSQRCVTGCTATALAQVVNYHKLPLGKGAGQKSYTWNDTTLSFDFEHETFDWENMLDEYDDNATDTQKDAVAKLMYACGVVTEMNYGPNASGALQSTAIPSLIDNFGFDKAIHVEYRQYYGRDDWDNLVYNELKQCGPVQFSGFNDQAGHAFVCDGYLSDGYFHFNWGWGGMSDGYFRLSALDPGAQGIGGSASGYTSGQSIVAGVRPPKEGSEPYAAISVSEPLGVGSSSTELGRNVTLTGGFFNFCPSMFEGDFGYRLYNLATGESSNYSSFHTSLPQYYGFTEYEIQLYPSLAEGDYRIFPAWSDGSKWHDMLVSQAGAPYIDMHVEGTVAYFSVNDEKRLSLSDVASAFPILIGRQATITGVLSNISDIEYWGNIRAALFTPDGQTAVAVGANFAVDLIDGETTDIKYVAQFSDLSGQTLTAGNYLLVFTDDRDRIISEPVTVRVTSVPAEQGNISASSLAFFGDSNNADPDDLNFNLKASCTSGAYFGVIYLFVFPVEGEYSCGNLISDHIYLEAGQSTEVIMHGAMPWLTPGTYFAAAYDADINLRGSQFSYFTVTETSGIESIGADRQEIISREYHDLSGRPVDAGNLVPGIYIVTERHADGSVTTSKKLVR